MPKITDYKTLTASYPDELDVKVQEKIDQGWQPYGHQFFQTAFHQPMVKRGNRKNPPVRIKHLNLSKNAVNALEKAGISKDHLICWLDGFNAHDLLKIRGCGKETIKEIALAASKNGVQMDISGFNEFKTELEAL